MSITTNSAGVACCGHCGSELEVCCSAGCANPDIEIREDPMAAPPISRQQRNIEKIARGICNVGKCDKPVAPQQNHFGRSPTKCIKHLEMSRRRAEKAQARKAAA